MASLPRLYAPPQPEPFAWLRKPVPFVGQHEGLWTVGRVGCALVHGQPYRVLWLDCDECQCVSIFDWTPQHGPRKGHLYRVTLDRAGDMLCDCPDAVFRHDCQACKHIDATRALFGRLEEERLAAIPEPDPADAPF